ncbi:MAG: hypothetical protein HQL31_11335, partial [Planctomycetes bacterium]|nr:hypothetical protein [Planctomycetota bacterium]
MPICTGGKPIWDYITEGKLEFGYFQNHLGISHHFITVDPKKGWDSRENIRMRFIASRWRDDIDVNNDGAVSLSERLNHGVSPILISCANYDYCATWPSGFAMSHSGEGLNATFFDGSVRWISCEEVATAGWCTTSSSNNYHY